MFFNCWTIYYLLTCSPGECSKQGFFLAFFKFPSLLIENNLQIIVSCFTQHHNLIGSGVHTTGSYLKSCLEVIFRKFLNTYKMQQKCNCHSTLVIIMTLTCNRRGTDRSIFKLTAFFISRTLCHSHMVVQAGEC